jgi:hypothetical protein
VYLENVNICVEAKTSQFNKIFEDAKKNKKLNKSQKAKTCYRCSNIKKYKFYH